jgi:hypothetical protein
MAKTDKTDKMVGGTKKSVDKVSWTVELESNGSTITLMGNAADAPSAALAAHQARQTFLDVANAAAQLKSEDTGKPDTTRVPTR